LTSESIEAETRGEEGRVFATGNLRRYRNRPTTEIPRGRMTGRPDRKRRAYRQTSGLIGEPLDGYPRRRRTEPARWQKCYLPPAVSRQFFIPAARSCGRLRGSRRSERRRAGSFGWACRRSSSVPGVGLLGIHLEFRRRRGAWNSLRAESKLAPGPRKRKGPAKHVRGTKSGAPGTVTAHDGSPAWNSPSARLRSRETFSGEGGRALGSQKWPQLRGGAGLTVEDSHSRGGLREKVPERRFTAWFTIIIVARARSGHLRGHKSRPCRAVRLA
jgi:hypothetical protein